MQTVLLAAGEGTRMRPLTATRPKPMLPVAGRPLLSHVAETAVMAGASRLIIVVGYEAESVKSYFEAEIEGVPITYVEQSIQRGTAHAVAQAKDELADAPFVVLNGDVLYDLGGLTILFDQDVAVGSYEVSNPSAYGVLEVSGNSVTGIEEKPLLPSSNLVNAGAYVFPSIARNWIDVEKSSRGELEITDVLERVIEQFEVTPVKFTRWLDVGRPWELLEANEWKLGELDRSIEGTVSEQATVADAVVIEPGATINSGVVIEGPAYIRAGASIGPNAYIRGSTLMGKNTHVGHAVEVKNSVLFDGATVGHLSYVGDSILGSNTNFGAGTTVANLRHDDESITMNVKGQSVDTGRRKFGVVCGDEVKTGINTSLNVGTVLETKTTTQPGEIVLSDRRN